MEIAIPGIALGLLYVVTNQNKTNTENFTNNTSELPNTNIPNKNYPSEYPLKSSETEQTSKLSTSNKYDNAGGVYTDKYFKTDTYMEPTGNAISQSSSGLEFLSLTGEKVDGSYFQHNNMVPFFGSNVRSQYTEKNSNESVLDNYVGSGSQTIIKKEVAPLFAPSENQSWAHGAPNMSDFYQSRVVPSMRMANVKPFEEQRVAPGLGLGYTNEGSGGYNSGMMMRDQWTEKNVDALRAANNPKPGGHMLYGYEGPSNSYIKNMHDTKQIGILEKNRPERSFEMFENPVPNDLSDFTKGKHYLGTTVGLEKGQTLRGIPTTSYKDTTRHHTTTDYIGGAGYGIDAEYIPGEYMPSHNIQLGEAPFTPANASGRNYANDAEFGIKAKTAYPNNRSVNKQDSYYGAVGHGLTAVVAPLLDILRPSRKENVIGTLRPYQNPSTTVPQSYIFNPADRPAPTIRETTENSKFHLNVNRNQNGGGYEVTEHQPTDTVRQTTGDFYYAGIAGSDKKQMKSYEAQYNQRNNDIKSATIDGRMVPGNMTLLNSDINMRQVSRDEYFKNSRVVVPKMPGQSIDVANMGQLQGHNNLYQGIQMDRNTSDMYDVLKSNPYVVNYKNAL
jgi:hypothetical protein